MTTGTNITNNIHALPRPASIVEKYTDSQIHDAAHEMEAIGGHFAACIAEAYFCADSHNKQLLLTAFGHLFERFISTEDNAKQN